MVTINEISEVSNGGDQNKMPKEHEKEEEESSSFPKVSSSSLYETRSTVLFASFRFQAPRFYINEFPLLHTIFYVPRSAIVTIGSDTYIIGVCVGQDAILIEFTTQQYRSRPSMRRALAGLIHRYQDRSSFPIPPELSEICIARVRRCNYPIVSQVSKNFRDMIATSSLYKTRSDLGVAECVLYASLRLQYTPKGSSLYVLNRKKLVLLDFLPHLPEGSVVVSVGGDLYVFGGCSGQDLLTDAIHIDCRTHKYRSLPSMRRGRYRAAAGFIDGMIYVIGGYREQGWYRDWIEVFIVEEEFWTYARGPHPYAHVGYEFCNYEVIDEKLYIWHHNFSLVYEPRRDHHWTASFGDCPLNVLYAEKACVINNVIFGIDIKCTIGYPIVVFDPELNTLKPVKGIALGDHGINSRQFLNDYWTKMANFGGKLVILGLYGREYSICCVTIVLESRDHGEIWGHVETVDHVFEHPETSPFIDRCSIVTI